MDESHVATGQLRGMYLGDRSRKETLVDYGFRLPAALDNRPLRFEEFEARVHQLVFVSATPGDYELRQSGGVVVEQVVRPTGLVDPQVEVRPVGTQVDDLLEEIRQVTARGERVLVTVLTKKLAEQLTSYYQELGVKAEYLHSEIDTLERVELLKNLRRGVFDVLIGINLLREGLDLPEVSLVAILDADKEGYLRSARSLIQTIGRAARNVNGKAILYADLVTDSMRQALDETRRRREKQLSTTRCTASPPRPSSASWTTSWAPPWRGNSSPPQGGPGRGGAPAVPHRPGVRAGNRQTGGADEGPGREDGVRAGGPDPGPGPEGPAGAIGWVKQHENFNNR